MNITMLKKLILSIPKTHTILIRGETGIGKSQIIREHFANILNLPIVDVRGSTMDETKASGIPDFETSKSEGVATFVLPAWYVRACREPVVLVLDEFNRAIGQVLQVFFQIIYDRKFGNNHIGDAYALHPDTRIVVLVNIGASYDVTTMDPALLRRMWVADLEPDLPEWLAWAAEVGIQPVICDFLRQHPEHWAVNPNEVDANKVFPSPASWHRLSDAITNLGGFEKTGELLYPLTMGYVGIEAALTFVDFVKRWSELITAEEVLAGEVMASRITGLRTSDILVILDKVLAHNDVHTWTPQQGAALCACLDLFPQEQVIYFWTGLLNKKQEKNIACVESLYGDKLIEMLDTTAKVYAAEAEA